jgi:osmotically-inducible protein OsmY
MNKMTFASTLLASFMVIAMAGCALGPKQESATNYLDDTLITTSVKKAIFDEPTLKVAEINVETDKGIVQLSGFVARPADVTKAAAVAGRVDGVKDVKNDIRLK